MKSTNTPKELIQYLRCPKCNSLLTHYSKLADAMICRRCGYKWKRPKELVEKVEQK